MQGSGDPPGCVPSPNTHSRERSGLGGRGPLGKGRRQRPGLDRSFPGARACSAPPFLLPCALLYQLLLTGSHMSPSPQPRVFQRRPLYSKQTPKVTASEEGRPAADPPASAARSAPGASLQGARPHDIAGLVPAGLSGSRLLRNFRDPEPDPGPGLRGGR